MTPDTALLEALHTPALQIRPRKLGLAVLLGGLALVPSASPAWAQACAPADLHMRFNVSVSLVGGPGCQGLADFIPTYIYGPDHLLPQLLVPSYISANGDGCPNSQTNFYFNATSGDGHYNFGAHWVNGSYLPSGPASGATCSNSACGCDGSASILLFPIDEPPLRCDECEKASPPNPNVHKPVNVLNGNVWFDQVDVSIPGVGPGLQFARSYNSKLAFTGVAGVFGKGWTHSYETRLSFLPSNILKVREGRGEPIFFADLDGDGTYKGLVPRLEKSTMAQVGANYVRTFREGGSQTFDASGRLVALTDPTGNITTLTRDPSGVLTTITEPGGRALTLAYEAGGKLSSLTGPLGVLTSYAYNGPGFLEKVSYPDGSAYVFSYDGWGQVARVADATGRTIEAHTYDSSGKGLTSEIGDGREKFEFAYGSVSTTVTDALGNATTFEWTSLQGITPRLTRITGACPTCGGGGLGRTAQWTYDDLGRVLTATDAFGKTTTYTYDANGDLQTETDRLGKTTTYTHDAQGRVLTVTRPDTGLTTYTHSPAGPLTVTEKVAASLNRTTTIAYTGQGKPQTITDPRSKVTTLGYNANGDLTSATDPLTHATTFGYDGLGRRTTVTDALSHTTTTAYDPRGRVASITNHDATHTDFDYDLGGRRTTVTDPLGRITRYGYDPYGRLASVVDSLNGETRYAYDLMSNLTGLTDAKGNTTSFQYDSYGRVSRVIYPGGAAEAFIYDAGGRLQTKTDRKAIVTTYAYDAEGRLTGKTYSDSTPAVTYTYDFVGRLLTAANGTDTLTWTYDFAGQLLTEQSTKNASTVAYTYDNGGNRATLGLNGTLFLTYGYDDASRLTTITKGSSVFGLGYDNANRRTTMTYPNGIATAYTYDNVNRLTRLKADLGATPVTDFQYVYDNAGNRTRKQQLDYTEDYTYDPLYRLTGAARTAGGTGLWQWAYDPVGNRTSAQLDNTVATSTYNEKNQLTSSTGGGPLRWRGTLNEPGTVAFTSALVNGKPAKMLAGNVFEAMLDMVSGNNTVTVQATDVSGNVTTKNYQVSVSGSGATYTYDANGNLSQKVEGADTWGYEWNAENQLTRVTKNSVEQARFKYDPLGRRVEKVAAGVTTAWTYDSEDILRQGAGGTTLKYVHGMGFDEALATDDGSALSYFHADGLGSIGKTTNSAGAATLSRRYDAWGNLELGSATTGYAFTGREWEPEAGLHYYRARYYDSKVGRFAGEDPLGFDADVNFFAYVGNSPNNHTDPLGLLAGATTVGTPAAFHVPTCTERAFTEEFAAAEKRSQGGGKGGWKFAHCMAACRLVRECHWPPVVAYTFGWANEAKQTVQCKVPVYLGGDPGACDTANAPEDYTVNETGFSCPKGTSCWIRCSKYWDQDKTPIEYGPYSSNRPK